MAAWRYEISLPVLKTFFTRSLSSLVKYFQHLKRNFVSPRGHVISSIYYLTPSFNLMLFCRSYGLNGKCFCGLWSDLLYRQLWFKVHDHQLCLRHQDWKTMEPQHSVHQSVRLQLHGGLQPQRKSAVRLGQQAFGHLSHLVWGTLGWLLDQLVMGLKKMLIRDALVLI